MNERLWTYHGYCWSAGSYTIRRGELVDDYVIIFEDEVVARTKTFQEATALCAAHAEGESLIYGPETKPDLE